MKIQLTPVQLDDLESLVAIRIAAMRESLERIGRFDLDRARQRFASGFDPHSTRHIDLDGKRVGFVSVTQDPHVWILDHLYIQPSAQNSGVGAAVLALVFEEADAVGLPIKVGALKESDSNRFYTRHGFERVESSEFDNYYMRAPSTLRGT